VSEGAFFVHGERVVFEGEPDLCGIASKSWRTTGAVSAQKGHSKSLNSTKLTGRSPGPRVGARVMSICCAGPAATSSGCTRLSGGMPARSVSMTAPSDA